MHTNTSLHVRYKMCPIEFNLLQTNIGFAAKNQQTKDAFESGFGVYGEKPKKPVEKLPGCIRLGTHFLRWSGWECCNKIHFYKTTTGNTLIVSLWCITRVWQGFDNDKFAVFVRQPHIQKHMACTWLIRAQDQHTSSGAAFHSNVVHKVPIKLHYVP